MNAFIVKSTKTLDKNIQHNLWQNIYIYLNFTNSLNKNGHTHKWWSVFTQPHFFFNYYNARLVCVCVCVVIEIWKTLTSEKLYSNK